MFSPRRSARRILPRAATAGDMSRMIGRCLPAGAAMQNGLVPSSICLPPQGGIAGEALENTIAIRPASTAGSA